MTQQCKYQCTVHGHRRVLLDEPLLLEPTHPAHHRVDPAAGPDWLGEVENQASHRICVTGLLGVLHRHLGPAVSLEPRGGPEVQVFDRIWFPVVQLPPQHVAKQVVVPVPLPVPVERDDQEVAALQLLEEEGGAFTTNDFIAQRTRHLLEHRRSGQEGHLMWRNSAEEL